MKFCHKCNRELDFYTKNYYINPVYVDGVGWMCNLCYEDMLILKGDDTHHGNNGAIPESNDKRTGEN